MFTHFSFDNTINKLDHYRDEDCMKKSTNNFVKDFFKIMCNVVFGKTMRNLRSGKDIKLVTTNLQRNKLASQPNYHCTNGLVKIY